VLALEQDAGVDQLRMVENARCTTCQVGFDIVTGTEKANRALERGNYGRSTVVPDSLDHDMTVRAISRLAGSGRPDH
jgi:hypothetical protein